MRTTALAALILASAGGARATERITVYVNSNLAPLDAILRAETISSQMFESAGVSVEWRAARPRSLRHAAADQFMIIDFERHTTPEWKTGSLAYALPFERVHIVVFWDRIVNSCRNNPELRPVILAHVITHEITHNLQGLVRHSASGIMKAKWDRADYLQMTHSPLTFTPEDIELLQAGMRRRTKAKRSTESVI